MRKQLILLFDIHSFLCLDASGTSTYGRIGRSRENSAHFSPKGGDKMNILNWLCWALVLVIMLGIAWALVSVNILPWLATIVGVFVGFLVYHYFFVSQVKKETDRLAKKAQERAARQA